MKATLLFLLLSSAIVSVGQITSYKLPETWDKNFVISTESTDNKRGGSVRVRFTYDSCIYMSSTTRDPKLKNKRVLLTQADRDAILTKLRELNIESIKSPAVPVQMVDHTIILCAGTACIDGGPASVMTEKDKAIFLSAYRFVNDLAMKK